ncbi:YdeI/OmpD-associated family protein [Cellulomonas chengniuliangii]|uniref:YdeI/OmpD-associated family protein n=1 Tax=Cellulomonas chengniuliangii TaxID=2968084 RepID=A0ABY5KZT5_9CELL|nr:YdeI/OmpD-associated family protein [Cellulomonas chengniuliangii]MCC2309791.1 YdeI/OmpD-associated family protein [Cellulomonas chengniuliangii]UUI74665.1 YdeI/OmpD-associated family protein [Cellulomonas chengniuliangii]
MPAATRRAPLELVVADRAAWRAWLDAHEDDADGVWLLLAKKGTSSPTSLAYAEALDEALCSGWIDGQRRGHDAATFFQRFTPRRARSIWSARNVEHVARLLDEGRMRARGLREVDRAQGDGRWDRAYAGAATAAVPEDLRAALLAAPGAQARFDAMTGQDRYALLHQLMTASTETVRARRLERLVEALNRDDAADAPR